MTSDYRLSPAVTARLVGLALVGIALLVLVTTVLVSALDLHTLWLVVPVVAGIGLLAVCAWLVRTRGWVVRMSDTGYQVQWVRGVGVGAARWSDVEDVVTATTAGSPCVVLRLRDGRTSTIPIAILATDRDRFVRDLQDHLQRGHGLRRL